ncbi:MAG: SGNH/GDSL hydrolase family protein [Thermodesulfobacteriota bacterium]
MKSTPAHNETHGTMQRRVVFHLVMVGISVMLVSLALICGEVAYRVCLYHIARDRFVRPQTGALKVFSRPFWRYHEEFGFEYPRDEKQPGATIIDSQVFDCWEWGITNSQGNVGEIRGDYESADLKILVFGDSFTNTSYKGKTWPSLLQLKLGERLGCDVNVVNFARDGTGILQMFDLAAAMIPEWKPDLAIIAFITNDLARVRSWRTVTKVDGLWRYLASPVPGPNPDPLICYDTGLYHPEATAEWCRRMKASRVRDRVIEEIEQSYQKGVGASGKRTADILNLRHSYLYAKLRYGDPFFGFPGAFQFPSVQYNSYAEDARFMDGLRRIKETHVPVVLVHLAYYPEFKAGKEYVLNRTEEKLLRSLVEITAHPIFETMSYISSPVESPERYIKSTHNLHPSLDGLHMYSDVVLGVLIEENLIPRCLDKNHGSLSELPRPR